MVFIFNLQRKTHPDNNVYTSKELVVFILHSEKAYKLGLATSDTAKLSLVRRILSCLPDVPRRALGR
jgi:hypothetical protein